jgi:hypothetical protein
MKTTMKIAIVILGIGVGMIGFNNCSPMRGQSGADIDLNSLGNDEAPAGNGEIVALEDTRTAGVVRANRALDNLVSCLGTGIASQAAKSAFREQAAALSADGGANSVTATMFVGFERVASEVCNDLINQERSMSNNQRRIFNEVNFE